MKLGGALAVVIALPLIEYLGFVVGADNSPEVKARIYYVYLYMPLIAYAIMFAIHFCVTRPASKANLESASS